MASFRNTQGAQSAHKRPSLHTRPAGWTKVIVRPAEPAVGFREKYSELQHGWREPGVR